MLVIRRKISESILIGDDIAVIITDIQHDKVQIAIKAPAHVKITRKELAETCEFNIMASENANLASLKNVKKQINKR